MELGVNPTDALELPTPITCPYERKEAASAERHYPAHVQPASLYSQQPVLDQHMLAARCASVPLHLFD
jgi:hypothetical protein